MKCPKCGKEIPDGALFCENCATEIKIVPEYEAKLEEQISSGMAEAAKVIAEEKGEPKNPEETESSGEDALQKQDTAVFAAVSEEASSGETIPEENADQEEISAAAPDAEALEEMASPAEARAQHKERRARRFARYAARRRYVKFMIVFMIGAFCATAFLVLFYSRDLYLRTHTKSYYVGRAYQLSSDGKYQQAADEIDKAIALGPGRNEDTGETASDAALYLRKSEYLQKAGEEGLALGAASMALEDDAATEDDVVAAYGRMIAIYASYEEYDKIAELLSKCTRPQVVENYLQYALFDPEFSEEDGTYEDTLTLTLSDQGDGSIFYTLDGSVPTTSSMLYTGPIRLTEGTYDVSAIYVNHFNLSSRVVTKHYQIDSTVPLPPEVAPKSGTYAKQMEITASFAEAEEDTGKDKEKSTDSGKKDKKTTKNAVSGTIYYTTNGEDPTAEDQEYKGPIMMPQGDSTFKFAVITDDGASSEVIERDYSYKISSSIGSSDGMNYILVALIHRGEIVDTAGTIPSGTAHYSFTYTGLQQIAGTGNFLMYSENLTDSDGNTVSTGRTYAVNGANGTVNLYSGGTLFPIG
mgnify:CR=1 FL=1